MARQLPNRTRRLQTYATAQMHATHVYVIDPTGRNTRRGTRQSSYSLVPCCCVSARRAAACSTLKSEYGTLKSENASKP